MKAKVFEVGKDVLVVLRHDPANSDPVDVAMVLDPETMFPGITQDRLDYAERYAIDREIEWIKQNADDAAVEAGADNYTDDQMFANSLTIDNFTKKTDLWFEVIEMPLTLREVDDAEV